MLKEVGLACQCFCLFETAHPIVWLYGAWLFIINDIRYYMYSND
jgi:hypothetical protein